MYIVKWRTADGKDRTKGGFPTRKAASAYATKVEDGKLRGVEFDPNAGKVLFRDAAAKWLASGADLKSATHNNHGYAWPERQFVGATARRSALTPCSATTR